MTGEVGLAVIVGRGLVTLASMCIFRKGGHSDEGNVVQRLGQPLGILPAGCPRLPPHAKRVEGQGWNLELMFSTSSTKSISNATSVRSLRHFLAVRMLPTRLAKSNLSRNFASDLVETKSGGHGSITTTKRGINSGHGRR